MAVGADGTVEIKITGSVDPSVAAAANSAKASFAGLTTAQASFTKEVLAGNLTLDALAKYLGKGAAAQETMAKVTAAVAAARAADTTATVAETVATEANTAATINSRAAYEATVLVHEALQGRFSRMVGSSMILGQQLAGQAATTSLVTFATSALGLSIIGTTIAIGTIIAATISWENENTKLKETTVGLGAASGLTADQLQKIGESSHAASQSVKETTVAAEAFASAGLHDAQTVQVLSNSIYAYSQLVGEKFADAQKELAEAMQDPIKGAQLLHDKLGILDGDQLTQIQTLTALGQKDQAVAIITQALAQRLDEAKTAGLGLRGEFGQLIDTLSNVYNWIGQVTEGFGREAETLLEDLIPALHQAGQAHRDAAAAAAQQAHNEAQLNVISAKGAAAYADTPEGKALKERTELIGKLKDSIDALKVDTAVHGANSEAVKRDRQAVEDYRHAVSTYVTEVQRKTKADQLDVQIAAARHAHNKQLVADLTEQKALLSQAGKVESEADAKALAAGAGDVAGAKVFAPKGGGKGPSIVSTWEEQLHEMEVLSNNFFEDQTSTELKFWQSKLALTKTGSKEWLDVQSKIYQANKSLARRDYDEHIADLNDRIEADRGDFKKFQSDWAEKLDYIKSKNGEESTAYKDAHRQMVSEERQFKERMLQEELTGNNREIAALKAHLAQMAQIRKTEASAAEAAIKANQEGNPFGDIAAASQVAQLHRQLAQQEIEDAQEVFDKEDALRQQGLADALAQWGAEDTRYKNAKQDELNATRSFYDQIKLLQAQSAAQQISDIIAIKNAYSQYVGSVVSAGVSGLQGLLDKTQTWRQAVIGIYRSVANIFDQIVEKMVTKWVVEHIFMTSAQRAQLAIQTGQHTAAEVTKTAATTTGVAARTGAESTGFFAKLLSFLGISVGTHTAAEGTKTTATVTGAATRAATEGAANAALVTSYSGVAGAAGVASWAAAPWPIDAGAPGFGASMAGAAAAFAPLAALDQGTNYLPRDQIIQAHEGERVIPKADNRKLMEMMSIAVNHSGRGDGVRDIHLHSSPTYNGNQASLWEHMTTHHEREMMRWFNRKFKNSNRVAA